MNASSIHRPVHNLCFAGLVVLAKGIEPDPIPNSAVKPFSAYGTSSQDAGESVAARPAKHRLHENILFLPETLQHDAGQAALPDMRPVIRPTLPRGGAVW